MVENVAAKILRYLLLPPLGAHCKFADGMWRIVVSVTAAAIIFFLLDLLKDLLREDMVVVVREGSREISVLIGIKVDI